MPRSLPHTAPCTHLPPVLARHAQGAEEQLGRFISGNKALTAKYLERLQAIHASLASCPLFNEHQFINTSLLFVHDVSGRPPHLTQLRRENAPLVPFAPSHLHPPSLTSLTLRLPYGPSQAGMQRCGVWMIDFSKARPASQPLTHTKAWELGNQEDGYLWGLSNLIRAWEGLL